MVALDYSALSKPVNRQEVRQFRRESAGSGLYRDYQSFALWAVVFVAAGVFTFISLAPAFNRNSGESSIPTITFIIVGVGIAFVVVLRIFSSRMRWTRLLRLSRFAHANGLEFSSASAVPPYPGMIFSIGSGRRVPERLTRLSDPSFDLGNLLYTTGSGKNKKVHHWSYVALKLDRMLPQIVLDAKANNLLFSNLPSSFARSQMLSLEGDFDRHFTLYCPTGYERDALYVLTPDLMTRLIDEAAGFDVEIVDDWLFFYSSRQLDLSDAADLAPVFALINTVGTKTLDRTERYADSNVANAALITEPGSPLSSRMSVNTIAPQGRRLRAGVPLVGVLVTIVVAAILLVNFAPIFFRF